MAINTDKCLDAVIGRLDKQDGVTKEDLRELEFWLFTKFSKAGILNARNRVELDFLYENGLTHLAGINGLTDTGKWYFGRVYSFKDRIKYFFKGLGYNKQEILLQNS